MNESQNNGDGAPNRQRELIEAAVRQAEEARRRANATASAPPSDPTLATLAPDSIAGYRIVRELHRGGQGVVYEAFQESTRRKVAIKVMKEGPLAGAADEARFDREVQVLGQLNHPNIVTIHDSGSAAGHHYFVMDYVPGQSLDAYMASARPSVDESMRLFARVCDAVNAAHLRGVIHRDLKPGNVRIDTEGEPRVLDFGLAKVATSDSDVSAMTITGQFVGSLPWASPEQAKAVPSKIDVRTDVYSLGVILYHMLTGRFPYNVVGNMRDVIDNILTAEPTRPSTIRGERGRLARRINDEVETIVLKCLHKERERRYQTAGELARDVKHYLNGEPIEAKRDSLPYVLRKRLKRHKVAVGFAAGLLAVVTAGFVTSLTFWRQAAGERDVAELARTGEEEQRKIAEEVNRFLNEDLLAAVVPSVEEGRGREVTVREVLDVAAERIEGRFADQPLVEAALRTTLGMTYWELGEYGASEPHMERALELRKRALGDENPETLTSMNQLAMLYDDLGLYDRAQELHVETLALQRRVLGDEHAETLSSMNNLGVLYTHLGRYEDAERLLREVLEIRRRVNGAEHEDTLTGMNSLAAVYVLQTRYDTAQPLLTEAYETSRRVLGEAHETTVVAMNNLAQLYYGQGKLSEALELYQDGFEAFRRVMGDEHPKTLVLLGNLAGLYYAQGHYEKAEQLFLELVATLRRVRSDEHLDTLTNMHNLGLLYSATRQYHKAEPLLADALETMQRVLGEEHRITPMTLQTLAGVYRQLRRYDEAEALYHKALEIQGRVLGEEHEDTLASMNHLGALYTAMGRLNEAEEMLGDAVERAKRSLPPGNPNTARILESYGDCLAAGERYDEAEKALLEAHDIFSATFGATNGQTISVVGSLTALYEDWDSSEPDTGKGDKASEWRAKLPPAQLANHLARRGKKLWGQGRHAEAELPLRECLRICREVLPEGDWHIYSAMSALGAALAGQEKFAEAEPLLIEGYEEMDPPPARAKAKQQALERIFKLYEAWDAAEPGQGYAEKAAEWRAKLPSTQPTSGPSDRAGEEDGSEPPRP